MSKKVNATHWEMNSTGFDKIVILGAGAIGSIYGAFLSNRNNVTLIGSKTHVQAVNSKGLSVSGDADETFYLNAETEIHEIRENTLIILTTKAYDSANAIGKIRNLLKDDTVILVLQNGIGNEEIVRRATGDKAHVLRGLTAMAAEFLEPGSIRFRNGETVIEKSRIAEKIVEAFNESILKARVSDDIKKDLWSKLVVNCVVNPLTALFQVRNHEILSRSLETIRHGIVRECVEVGRAEGVNFPERFEVEVDERISDYKNFSSMCQDVMMGKRTEIDFLNERVAELGRKHQVPALLNETFVCLIRFQEEKNGVSRRD